MSAAYVAANYRGKFLGLTILDQLRLGDRVRAEVVAEFGVTEAELTNVAWGGRQDPRVLRARRQAIIGMRRADMSWESIAASLGYGHHTGPYHLIRRQGAQDPQTTSLEVNRG